MSLVPKPKTFWHRAGETGVAIAFTVMLAAAAYYTGSSVVRFALPTLEYLVQNVTRPEVLNAALTSAWMQVGYLPSLELTLFQIGTTMLVAHRWWTTLQALDAEARERKAAEQGLRVMRESPMFNFRLQLQPPFQFYGFGANGSNP